MLSSEDEDAQKMGRHFLSDVSFTFRQVLSSSGDFIRNE